VVAAVDCVKEQVAGQLKARVGMVDTRRVNRIARVSRGLGLGGQLCELCGIARDQRDPVAVLGQQPRERRRYP
jgi:hypothetical protein